MSGNIFVSYRREDSKHAAGRLVDRLERTFAHEQLFMDVDDIGLGLDFSQVIADRVAGCELMLVMIGPNWLTAKGPDGTPRLDDPKDFVRLEIEAALARDIRVIPLLVDGAQPPGEADLPPSLAPLAFRQATRLDHESFVADADRLTDALADIVQSNKQAPPSPKDMGGSVPEDTPPIAPERDADNQLPPAAEPTPNPERHSGASDWHGWITALAPVWLGLCLVFVITTFGLSPSHFNWFGWGGEPEAYAVPLFGTALLWLVRLIRPVPLARKIRITGTALAAANFAVVVAGFIWN